jgi:hypothetical protein
MNAEHSLIFERVTQDTFGGAAYENLTRLLGVDEAVQEARHKVESLARYVKESRAAIYQRIAFLISCVLAPLSIAAGLYRAVDPLFPADKSQAAHLIHLSPFLLFGLVFAFVYLNLFLIWIITWKVLGRDSARPSGLATLSAAIKQKVTNKDN